MFKIKILDEFNAAHNLRGYRGRCEQLHGHNWKVEVIISGDRLNRVGLLMDFRKLRSRLKKVLKKLDHKYLNNIAYFRKRNPTSENIARYIFENLKSQVTNLELVVVWESDDSSASYYGR